MSRPIVIWMVVDLITGCVAWGAMDFWAAAVGGELVALFPERIAVNI